MTSTNNTMGNVPVALRMALDACDKPTFWTDWEDMEWEEEGGRRQDPGPVIVTSAAAAPIGASASSGNAAMGDHSLSAAMIRNLSTDKLRALIHVAQAEISRRQSYR